MRSWAGPPGEAYGLSNVLAAWHKVLRAPKVELSSLR